jgi:hypothetical protein
MMAPRKAAKGQAIDVSDQPPEQSDSGLEGLLLSKVVEQIDTRPLALKLAPELANCILSRRSIDVLRDRLLDLRVAKMVEDPELVDAVSTRILAQLNV